MENRETLPSPEKEKLTTLMSLDGHIFPVEEAVIVELRAIRRLLPAAGDATIPISQVTGQILAKIIDYCRKHNDHKLNRLRDEEISAWDRHFVDVDEEILFDLLVASHFLEVKDLFYLTVTTVTDMMKTKSPAQVGNMDQLRNLFISNFRLD
ncbi:SKP1-like protein 12 [Salvia miltiorrhiza]|uniref:SKP1-like protein 12 n=1 Tax=Salvia miltiorrhiza TaxID=226208 RepID=UPI0025AD77A6|nr:SKP1-like protein 12 [Salvia miltiorrhiza]